MISEVLDYDSCRGPCSSIDYQAAFSKAYAM